MNYLLLLTKRSGDKFISRQGVFFNSLGFNNPWFTK